MTIRYKRAGALGGAALLLAAGAILVSVPVMVLFFVLQRHLIGGLAAGAVKG